MRYMSSIYISDVMDQVALTVELQAWSDQFGPPEVIYQKTLVWPGVGATEPTEWLGRALFLASQELTTPTPREGRGRCGKGVPNTISETGDRRI